MLRNYLTTAFRRTIKNPGYTSINLLGLVIGIASSLIIVSIIRFELSFDKFHTDADRIYRIVTVSQVDGHEEYQSGVASPLPKALQSQVPGLDKITTMLYWPLVGVQVDIIDKESKSVNRFTEKDGFVLLEPSFFDVFDFADTGFKWIEGNPKTALVGPNSIVITRSLAEKYFPESDPLSKTLHIGSGWGDKQVTGVIEDLPANSDFPFKAILSYSSFMSLFEPDWKLVGENQCYLTLPASMTREELENQIGRIHRDNVSKDISTSRKYKLQPLSEVHQDSRFGNYNRRVVSRERLLMLGAIGFFLLLVVCVNYVNLATAQSSQRSKEVGIRKVLGSDKWSLRAQVMTESFLIVAIAGVIGLVVAQLAIVNFQDLLNATAETSLLTDFFTWILLLAIVIVVSLLAGIYPAYIISVFNPLQAIKSNISTTLGGFRLRQLLVVFQFTITQVLVIGTFVVVKQMNYFQTKDLGYNSQSILNISIPFGEERQKRFASKVQEVAPIENISFSGTPAGYYRTKFNLRIKRPEWTSSIEVENQWVDSSYLGLYDMKLVAGRNFFPQDSLKGFIINETLASALDFASPEEAIGRPIVINNRRYTIIGVVHDFHSQSLKEEVDKVALSQRHDNRHRMVGVKLSQGVNSTDAITHALASIETAWSDVYPELAFDFRFFDESLQAYYEEELRLSKLFQIFSIVFIVIGCLGLYGLISFVVNRKMKEVAVRKVFGATVANILVLIGRDYVKLVVIAFSIAVPTAYNLMQNWLNSFAYHTDISWWVLLLPGVMVLLVAMLAVSGQSLKAASVNPSRILKDE